MRRRGRVDDNQRDIVTTLRQIPGVSVVSLADAGGGVPDLMVGFRGQTALLEVKDGHKAPSAQALTPAQECFRQSWTGSPIHIVRSASDAYHVVLEAMR